MHRGERKKKSSYHSISWHLNLSNFIPQLRWPELFLLWRKEKEIKFSNCLIMLSIYVLPLSEILQMLYFGVIGTAAFQPWFPDRNHTDNDGWSSLLIMVCDPERQSRNQSDKRPLSPQQGWVGKAYKYTLPSSGVCKGKMWGREEKYR